MTRMALILPGILLGMLVPGFVVVWRAWRSSP